MVERICPQCQQHNPVDNRFCGQCGAALARHHVIPRPEQSLTISPRPLPAQQLKQLGQTVAIGVLTLAAEAALSWLRRRLEQRHLPAVDNQAAVLRKAKPQKRLLPPPRRQGRSVFVIRERIVAFWQEDLSNW